MAATRISGKRLQVTMHIIVWSVLFIIPTYLIFRETDRDRYFMMAVWLQLAFYASIFYLSYFGLAPRFFFAGKKTLYFIYTGLAIVVFTMILGFYYFRLDPYFMGKNKPMRMPPDMGQLQGQEIGQMKAPASPGRPFPGEMPPKPLKFWPFVNFFLTSSLVTGLSLGLRLSEELSRNEKIRKEADKQKLNTELLLLKHQINPHFLFNTLNSIYSLALIRSDQTPEAVMKLSDMMRYVIQDAAAETVPLNLELEYLGHYVELQQMRLSPGNKVFMEVTGDPGPVAIPPMILVPFIENAFKYGTSAHEPAAIRIRLAVSETLLKFHVENRIFEGRDKGSTFGIGIQNTRQRLGLLYPGRHTLNLANDGNTFTVDLEIRLS